MRTKRRCLLTALLAGIVSPELLALGLPADGFTAGAHELHRCAACPAKGSTRPAR